jgi:hypothetical protein
MNSQFDRTVAKSLIGKQHYAGRFVSFEEWQGHTVLTSECTNVKRCGGIRQRIPLQSAHLAVQHPEQSFASTACPVCVQQAVTPKRATAAPQNVRHEGPCSYTAACRACAIEKMSPEQYRKEIVEPEHAARFAASPAGQKKAAAAIRQTEQLQASYIRFLRALQAATGAMSPVDEAVLNHPDWMTRDDFFAMSAAAQSDVNAAVDDTLHEYGLDSFGRR